MRGNTVLSMHVTYAIIIECGHLYMLNEEGCGILLCGLASRQQMSKCSLT